MADQGRCATCPASPGEITKTAALGAAVTDRLHRAVITDAAGSEPDKPSLQCRGADTEGPRKEVKHATTTMIA